MHLFLFILSFVFLIFLVTLPVELLFLVIRFLIACLCFLCSTRDHIYILHTYVHTHLEQKVHQEFLKAE